jgi:hypothetical protein
LKKNPTGIDSKEVAEKVGCKVSDLYVWYVKCGKKTPGVTVQKGGILGWDQTLAG